MSLFDTSLFILGSFVPEVAVELNIPDGDEKIISVKVFIIIIAAAAGTLGTAISILFRATQDLNKKYADLNKDFGRIQGKHDGIQELSYRVLDAVHTGINGRHTSNNTQSKVRNIYENDSYDDEKIHNINKNKNDFLE